MMLTWYRLSRVLCRPNDLQSGGRGGTFVPHIYMFFFCALLLSSSWTGRGHRCRLFSPPVLGFPFLSRIGFSTPTALTTDE